MRTLRTFSQATKVSHRSKVFYFVLTCSVISFVLIRGPRASGLNVDRCRLHQPFIRKSLYGWSFKVELCFCFHSETMVRAQTFALMVFKSHLNIMQSLFGFLMWFLFMMTIMILYGERMLVFLFWCSEGRYGGWRKEWSSQQTEETLMKHMHRFYSEKTMQ